MKINYLKEFIILTETESYQQASERLSISQSSLSKHIKTLEAEIGFPLFTRTTRTVKLNEYGKILYKYARQIVDLHAQYITEFKSLSENEDELPVLNIGSMSILPTYSITDAIVKFMQYNKNCYVNLSEEEPFVLKDLLRRNQCELAFMIDEDMPDSEFIKVPFMTEHLFAILPAGHPLAQEQSIALNQLSEENFLLFHRDSFFYELCVKSCLKEGFNPNITYTGKRFENILDLVAKGVGVSLWMQKPQPSLSNHRIAIVNISPQIDIEIKIYYKKDTPLPMPARHFIDSALRKTSDVNSTYTFPEENP